MAVPTSNCSNIDQTCCICSKDWCNECWYFWRTHSDFYDAFSEREMMESDEFTCLYCFIDMQCMDI